MSMIFRFRMLSDENDRFVRDYEVLYDTSLLDFHRFILSSLDYEECMASFFTADDRWEKQREFTCMEMGIDGEEAPEFTGSYEADKDASYPREIFARAEAPDQYDPSRSRSDDEGSIFDDAMGDFSDFEGDDSYDDEY